MEPGIGVGQLPPFHELGEYVFQDLCRDLFDAEESVETCEVYGKRGQKQYGIDLLAHRADGEGIELGQCKRYASFTPEQIIAVRKEFFQDFGHGKRWRPGTVKRFILFVTCDLSSTGHQETIREEKEKFGLFGIRYEVWGSAKIRNKLRPHQGIVSTYLSPPEHWVQVICGVAASPAFSPEAFSSRPRVTTVVDAALLERVERLESQGAERRLDEMREAWREGHHGRSLSIIEELKKDAVSWASLFPETKARVLRFEAGVRLDVGGDVTLAQRLADEARTLAPNEDEARVRALIARADEGPAAAAILLEGRGDADSVNLRASFLLEAGDAQACREALLEAFGEGPLQPGASTFQLQALLHLLDKELDRARLEAQKALELAPRWEGVRFTAATVGYLSALSPAALPEYLVAWPEPVDWMMVKRDDESLSRLREAAEVFHVLTEDVDEPAARGRYEVWRLACLANDPERQDEAVRHCRLLLEADSANHQALLWAATRSLSLDLAPSKDLLNRMVSDGTAEIPHVLVLCRLLTLAGDTDQAVALLDETRTCFEKKEAQELWASWRAQAQALGGDPQAALKALDDRGDVQDLRRTRAAVLGMQAQQTGNWTQYLAHIESSYAATADPTYLLDACELKALHEEWAYVAERARELVEGIDTADALRLAAMGAHNDGKFDLCLELLDGRRDLFAGGGLPRELRQMRLSCQSSLGLLASAGAAAEELTQEEPSFTDLSNLLLVRMDQADRPAVVLAARRLADHPDLDAAQALGIAEVVLLEDRELAVRLWRKVQDDLPERLVTRALNLGFKLGLDKEAGQLAQRAIEMGERDSGGGLQRSTIQDVLELMARQHERAESIRQLYLEGTAPIHVVSEALDRSLVDEYHRRLLGNEASDAPYDTDPLLIEYGGRSAFEAPPAVLTERRLVLDVTAVLLAEHLGILDKVEAAFGEVWVPRELGRALFHMRDRAYPHQPSQVEDRKAIVRMAEAGKLSEEWPELPPTYENPQLVQEMGERWAAALERVRAQGGYLVDSLPLSKSDLSGPPSALPEGATEHIVNSCSILEALRRVGALPATRAAEAAEALGEEGRKHTNHPDVPAPGSHLFLDSGMATVLVRAGLLQVACERFVVHFDPQELVRVRAELRAMEASIEASGWLNGLMDRLNRGLDQGTYKAVVAPPLREEEPTIDSQDPVVLCMDTIFRFEPQQRDVIWVDDRALNRFPGRLGVAIVGIRDVLDALVDAGAMNEEERYSILVRLKASNARFLPLSEEEILHHLNRAQVVNSEVVESWELSVLRRYAGACMLQDEILARSTMTDGVAYVGEMPFIARLQRAVAEALRKLWEVAEDEVVGRARAEWLLANMYLGYAGVTNVVKLPGSAEDERPKVASDLAHITIRSVTSVPGANGSERQEWRLRWLEERLLQVRFDADPALVAATANEVKQSIEDVRGSAAQIASEPLVSRTLRALYDDLPGAIREELALDANFMASVGLKNMTVMQIGPFRFDHEELWRAATEAVNGRPTTISTVGDEPTEVSLLATEEPATLLLADPQTGEGPTVSHDLFPVLLESATAREDYLREQRRWFDCPEDRFQGAVAEVATITDPVRRVKEAEGWRNSSAAFFYKHLRGSLERHEPIPLNELIPPDAERLIEHLRLPPDGNPERPFGEVLAAAAEALIEEEGLQEALERLASLPVPLPQPLLDRVDGLPPAGKRALVACLIGRGGSPVSRVHLVRLLTHIGEAAYSKLARRTAMSLLGEGGAGEWEAFSTVLRWTNDEFDAKPDLKGLPPRLRLAAVWCHAHRMLAASASAGLSHEVVVESLSLPKQRLTSEVFEREDEYWRDLCHPRRVNRVVFVYAGLGYGFGKEGDGRVVEALEEDGAFGSPASVLALLGDPSLAWDGLGSFMGGNRAEIMSPLLDEEGAEALTPSFLRAQLEEAIEYLDNPVDPEREKLAWGVLYLLLDEQPPPKSLSDRLQAALSSASFARLVREDAGTGLPALRTACLQVPNLASEDLRSRLKEQLAASVRQIAEQRQGKGTAAHVDPREPERRKELLSILDSAVHLSVAAPDDPVAEFGEMMITISDAWPGSAPFCKLVVLRLCEQIAPQQAKPLYRVLTCLRSR